MKRSRPSDAGGAKPAAKKGGDASAGKRRLLDSDCDDDAGADSTGTATDDSEGTNMVEFGNSRSWRAVGALGRPRGEARHVSVELGALH